MNSTLYTAATLIVPLVIAIVFHEVAHGWVASLLGDQTARERRRLSLNPLRHVDPIGTVVLPGFLALIKAPVFGWARPVPVNQWRLRNPRYGMMAVAAAGPATNLVLALAGAVALGLVLRTAADQNALSPVQDFVARNLANFLQINVFLAMFNLLPVPPFDGSHIVEGVLPRRAAIVYARARPYGLPIMMVLLFVLPQLMPQLHLVERLILPPVDWLLARFGMVVNAAAGFAVF